MRKKAFLPSSFLLLRHGVIRFLHASSIYQDLGGRVTCSQGKLTHIRCLKYALEKEKETREICWANCSFSPLLFPLILIIIHHSFCWLPFLCIWKGWITAKAEALVPLKYTQSSVCRPQPKGEFTYSPNHILITKQSEILILLTVHNPNCIFKCRMEILCQICHFLKSANRLLYNSTTDSLNSTFSHPDS